MKQRIDRPWLTDMVKRRKLSETTAAKYAALGLFILPKEGQIPEWDAILDQWSTKVDGPNYVLEYEEFILHEFMLYWPDGNLYFNVNYIDETKVIIGVVDLDAPHKDQGWTYFDIAVVPGTTKMTLTDVRMTGVPHDEVIAMWHVDESAIGYIGTLAVTALATLQMWFNYNHVHDRYVISVKSEGKQATMPVKTRNRVKRVEFGPRYIFLDKLPVLTVSGESNGKGEPRAAHQRRGYHVTLRADRFKSHPKYMVPNAIYRKPAWVGDRSTVVNGNVYTVMDLAKDD